jgi:acyl-CoA dehydrogenase
LTHDAEAPAFAPDIATVRAFLDESHPELAERAAVFARRELAGDPGPPDDAGARRRAREILAGLGAGGWLDPIAAGDFRACCLLRETLAAASPLADAVFALQALGTVPIRLAGSDALTRAWLEPALTGGKMAAFAMTEPGAGSDVAAIATRAVRDGDAYVLDGRKTLISNAGLADFYVVFASTDPEVGRKGLSAFVVPAETPGLRFVGPQVMSAPHPLGDIAFEGCRVPADHRLGEEGAGLPIGLATLDRLRPTVGAAACGMASRALHEALGHVMRREQFGRRLADFQLVQEKLGRMATELAAARLLVYRAAWERDRGAERTNVESAMAKAFATEAAQRVIDEAVQLLGGRGVLADSVVDRLYRSVRALRIYEGTTEIQRLVVGAHLIEASSP